MRSDQPKRPAVAIVGRNGLYSASSRASVAVTPASHGRSDGSKWWVDDRWLVSTPAKAGHHHSSWYKFEGSGLLVHDFEVWRRDQKDQVFVYG